MTEKANVGSLGLGFGVKGLTDDASAMPGKPRTKRTQRTRRTQRTQRTQHAIS